jgi:hypothetical protein
MGRIFGSSEGEDLLPNEQKTLSLVMTGGELNDGLAASLRNLDFYDLKGRSRLPLMPRAFMARTFRLRM